MSVRARIAITAAVITAIAVTLVSVLLLRELNTSLDNELDSSLARVLSNYEETIFEYDDFGTAPVPIDQETFFALIDADGEAVVANDQGFDPAELDGQLDLSIDDEFDVRYADLRLQTATDVDEPETLRAAYQEVLLGDQLEGEVFFAIVARSYSPTDRTVTQLRNVLAAGVPLLVIFVAALAWWLTGRALRPVDLMREEVDEITSTDLERRVSEPGMRDEVGQLAVTMNNMLGRLEEAQRSQNQFVSDAAHELRTPLASMAAQLDVDATHPDTANHAATAANMRAEVTRLQILIDGLLASARSQRGASNEERRLLDLDVMAGERVQKVARPANLFVDLSHIGAGTIRAEPTAVSRVIDNLLANAYRHASSRVAVSVGTDAAGVWMAIDDDGTGIAPADRTRVFDRFVRLDEARSKDGGGSGLGLALAREAVEHHSGTLHIEDSPLGGARFVLRLPAA